MKFCTSKMYCKYVINLLNKAVNEIRSTKHIDLLLEDRLYESYLKLEKFLNDEFF